QDTDWFRADTDEAGCLIATLRQRNEFRLARYARKALLLPIRLGLFDAFARAADEIPPDETRAIQWLAAEQHHPRWSDRTQQRQRSRFQHRQVRDRQQLGFVQPQFASHRIQRALGMIAGNYQFRAVGEIDG